MLAKLFISLVRISPSFQKAVWKWWYQRLGKRGHDIGWTFMNYGFTPDNKEQSPNLKPEDESNRMFIQLYDYAASQIPLDGLKVLEVGSGRGGGASFIARYYNPKSMTGLDYSPSAVKLSNSVHEEVSNLDFVEGDAENLPFEDKSFDIITIAFGFRNISNQDKALQEFNRILKNKGKLLILEFSQPQSKFFGMLYKFYSYKIMPKVASLITKKYAYEYLPESIDMFSSREEIKNKLEFNQFRNVEINDMTFGISTIFSGFKNDKE